jgi:hypothetical protein
MISEPTAFQASTPSMGTGAWRTHFGRRHLAGVGAMARRLSSALSSWACAPIEPYAALREASTLLGLMNEPTKTLDPDPYSTEAPFLTGTWPRLEQEPFMYSSVLIEMLAEPRMAVKPRSTAFAAWKGTER